MPRQSRKQSATGIYHISQTGGQGGNEVHGTLISQTWGSARHGDRDLSGIMKYDNLSLRGSVPVRRCEYRWWEAGTVRQPVAVIQPWRVAVCSDSRTGTCLVMRCMGLLS